MNSSIETYTYNSYSVPLLSTMFFLAVSAIFIFVGLYLTKKAFTLPEDDEFFKNTKGSLSGKKGTQIVGVGLTIFSAFMLLVAGSRFFAPHVLNDNNVLVDSNGNTVDVVAKYVDSHHVSGEYGGRGSGESCPNSVKLDLYYSGLDIKKESVTVGTSRKNARSESDKIDSYDVTCYRVGGETVFKAELNGGKAAVGIVD